MGNHNKHGKVYGPKPYSAPFSLILFIAMSICIVGTTVAFFFASDWASSFTTLSGKVDIEAVGEGTRYDSIEDTVDSSNLIITLGDDYKHLIPNMPYSMPANVKVYQSTSKPLLRAKFTMQMYQHVEGGDDIILDDAGDKYDVMPQMTEQLHDIITGNGWLLNEEDMYYYYIGTNTKETTLTDTLLSEVDVTAGDVIIHFINEEITFPSNVESDMSGFNVQFQITFQAIQNYIPDASGAQLPNTITNSKIIFDDTRPI